MVSNYGLRAMAYGRRRTKGMVRVRLAVGEDRDQKKREAACQHRYTYRHRQFGQNSDILKQSIGCICIISMKRTKVTMIMSCRRETRL